MSPNLKEKLEFVFGTIVIAFTVACLAITFLGCTPKRLDVPIFWDQTPAQQAEAARLHAKDVSGLYTWVLPTGSMEPYIAGGGLDCFQKDSIQRG